MARVPWGASFAELASVVTAGAPSLGVYVATDGTLHEAIAVLAKDDGALVALPPGALDSDAERVERGELGAASPPIDVVLVGVRGTPLQARVPVIFVDVRTEAMEFFFAAGGPDDGVEVRRFDSRSGRRVHGLSVVQAALGWVHGGGAPLEAGYGRGLEAFLTAESGDEGRGEPAAGPSAGPRPRDPREEQALTQLLQSLDARLSRLEAPVAFAPAAPAAGPVSVRSGAETPRWGAGGFDARPLFDVQAETARRGIEAEAARGDRAGLRGLMGAAPGPEIRRGRAGPSGSAAAALAREGDGPDEDGEEAELEGPLEALLKAVTAQTRMMNKFLGPRLDADEDVVGMLGSTADSVDGPVATGVRGALQRERLRQILDTNPGEYSRAVQQNMKKRVGAYGDVPPDPQAYLERYGGYDKHKELGLINWLVAAALKAAWSGQHESAMDRLALLMVVIEQTNLDHGTMDLSWLLSLEEEPPFSVFSKTAQPATQMGKAFSPLASQKWVTVSMAFLKELDTLQTRRQDVVRQRPGAYRGGAAQKDDGPNPKAKAKGKPKQDE